MYGNILSLFSYFKQRLLILQRLTVLKKPNKRMDVRQLNDIPLVVVLGETGVGKTKLAVELCRRFNGEVISADSMQIYKGLDIITNKVTPEESCGIPHHMMNILSPLSSNFNVQLFQNQALKIIEEMWRNRRVLPVIVGGTNYYIESLLWNRLVSPGNDCENESPTTTEFRQEKHFTSSIPFDVDVMTDEELHEELRKVDPITAGTTHPKNRRRVIRSIQIFYQTRRPHSEWLTDQHAEIGANRLAGSIRFRRVCLLWMTCDVETLKERLKKRVDEMVTRGLRDEISEFYDRYYSGVLQKDASDATTKGILQSIGLKEFEKYLTLPTDRRVSSDGSNAFEEGVEKLKFATIKYARKQRQWITNRLCKLAARDSVHLYRLNGTDANEWERNVSLPAAQIVDAFLASREPKIGLEIPVVSVENELNEEALQNRYCEICNRVISGRQWPDHSKSKVHRILRLKKARREPPADTRAEAVTN